MAEPFSLRFEQRKFRTWVHSLTEGVEDVAAPQALKKVAFDFTDRVVRKTPVRTGRARAGWMAWAASQTGTGGSISLGQIGEGGGSEVSSRAIREGLKDGDYEENLRGAAQFITIINGVNYILPLEFGYSDQAPAGMVRITMREMQAGAALTKEMMKELEQQIIEADRLAFAFSSKGAF